MGRIPAQGILQKRLNVLIVSEVNYILRTQGPIRIISFVIVLISLYLQMPLLCIFENELY
jgi:hypothetical protein